MTPHFNRDSNTAVTTSSDANMAAAIAETKRRAESTPTKDFSPPISDSSPSSLNPLGMVTSDPRGIPNHETEDASSAYALTMVNSSGTSPKSSTSTSTLSMTTEQFRDRLEALPQEVYDEIRSLTFTFDFKSENRCIDENYRLPVLLQLNKQIRTDFMKQYYGALSDWEFVFSAQGRHPRGDAVQSWLQSLSLEAILAFPVVNEPAESTNTTNSPAAIGVPTGKCKSYGAGQSTSHTSVLLISVSDKVFFSMVLVEFWHLKSPFMTRKESEVDPD